MGKEAKIKSYAGSSAAMRPVSCCVPKIDCQSISQTQGAVTDNLITPPPHWKLIWDQVNRCLTHIGQGTIITLRLQKKYVLLSK